jgi:hypothetical protein
MVSRPDDLDHQVSDGNAQGLEDALKAFLDTPMSPAGFAIHYRIGDAFSGETELHLHGDGAYELWSTATQGRERRTYEGSVDEEVVRELAGELREAKVWQAAHVRSKPREDDPLAEIAAEADQLNGRVELWVSEIADSAPFRTAQEHLLRVVRELSRGEVVEEGR